MVAITKRTIERLSIAYGLMVALIGLDSYRKTPSNSFPLIVSGACGGWAMIVGAHMMMTGSTQWLSSLSTVCAFMTVQYMKTFSLAAGFSNFLPGFAWWSKPELGRLSGLMMLLSVFMCVSAHMLSSKAQELPEGGASTSVASADLAATGKRVNREDSKKK